MNVHIRNAAAQLDLSSALSGCDLLLRAAEAEHPGDPGGPDRGSRACAGLYIALEAAHLTYPEYFLLQSP